MNVPSTLLLLLIVLAAAGCDTGPKSAKGFRLPDGDVEHGRATFVALRCHACHTVEGVQLPEPLETPEVSVALGGEVRRIQTYGELVTSIINPSHELPRRYPKEEVARGDVSKMKIYNDIMTVTQLCDLVAFLQAQYEIVRDDTLYYAY